MGGETITTFTCSAVDSYQSCHWPGRCAMRPLRVRIGNSFENISKVHGIFSWLFQSLVLSSFVSGLITRYTA